MNAAPLLAYIDPGSGFIVLQVIIAGAIGGLLYFRQILWSVVGAIPGFRKKSETLLPGTNEDPKENLNPNSDSQA